MNSLDRKAYVQAVLNLYQSLYPTATRPRPADRRLAAQLHHRGIRLEVVEIALRLAAARRAARPPDAQPLTPVRSLHYFLPVINELPTGPPPDGYLDYLRERLQERTPSNPTSSSSHRPRQLQIPFGERPENDVS